VTGAGAFSFTENALYTVEGWQVFLDHLKPDGLFTVSRWHSPENLGETGRTVSLAVAALLRRGITDPARHIAMLTATNLSTIMLSQQPMSAADITGLRALHEDLGFKLEILPGEPPENPAYWRALHRDGRLPRRACMLGSGSGEIGRGLLSLSRV
jgi:hypothetical protein